MKVQLRLRTYGKEEPEGFPIVYYIRYGGKPYYRRTGYFSEVQYWNADRNCLRVVHPKGQALINYLNQEMLHLQIQLTKAEAEGLSFLDALSGLDAVPSFTQHFETRIQELFQAGDLGNMNFYRQQLNWLKANISERIEFKDLDYSGLQKIVAFSDGMGHSYNTIRQRIQTIKAVYNNAVKRYPGKLPALNFSGLLAGRSSGRVSAREVSHQPLEVVKQLMKLENLSAGQQRALDVWRLAFLMQGAGVIDILYLNPVKIKRGYYPLKRLKMPKKNIVVNVLLNPQASEIIRRYKSDGRPYVFDYVDRDRNDKEVLSGNQIPEGTRQYSNARTTIDKNLKRLSKALSLEKPLSMVQARHSWVIIARDLGVSKELIQQCIGHQGQEVIDRHYFGKYDQAVLDEANLKVFQLVSSD